MVTLEASFYFYCQPHSVTGEGEISREIEIHRLIKVLPEDLNLSLMPVPFKCCKGAEAVQREGRWKTVAACCAKRLLLVLTAAPSLCGKPDLLMTSGDHSGEISSSHVSATFYC